MANSAGWGQGDRALAPVRRLVSRHGWGLALCLAIVAWRFWQARGLALPAWVDSVHHTLLVRVLLEQHTLPATWAPYLPEVPFYYHFGFHASAALLAAALGWSGIELGRAVLVAGHVWHGVLAAGVYALACQVWGDRRRAVVATLLVGVVCEMPAFYAAWGRYTLLAGLALLAWAAAAALAGRTLATAVLVAATSVTHEYAFLLLLLFLAIAAVTVEKRRPVVWGGAAGLLLALPWQWRMWSLGQRYGQAAGGVGSVAYDPGYLLGLLGPPRNAAVWALAVVGLAAIGWQLLRAYRPAGGPRYALAGWALACLVLLGPWAAGPFSAYYAAIVLFMPAALLAAGPLGQRRWPAARWAAVGALVLWGAWETRSVARADLVLAGQDDVAAAAWVAAHTPAGAVIVIDATPWLGVWRGVDGGYWLAPLTGRRTLVPPVPYAWGPAAGIERTNALAARLAALSGAAGPGYCPGLLALMADAGAAYYYSRSAAPAACAALHPIYRSPAGQTLYYAP